MKSWKSVDYLGDIQKHLGNSPEIRDFGDAWGISHGLRFGEVVSSKGIDEYGEAREIWSPITKEIMELWSLYRTSKEGTGLEENYLIPDFVQIDDREWSLGFSAHRNFASNQVEDFCEFLADIGLASKNLFFDVWAETTEELDLQKKTRVGITKQSNFRHNNKFVYSELSSPPMRDTPLAHKSNGELVHLEKRSFEICKFCNFSGVVWCNKQQVAILDRYQDGDSRGFLEYFTAWDYVTFALGFHQHCIKENLSNDKIEGLYGAALKDLT